MTAFSNGFVRFWIGPARRLYGVFMSEIHDAENRFTPYVCISLRITWDQMYFEFDRYDSRITKQIVSVSFFFFFFFFRFWCLVRPSTSRIFIVIVICLCKRFTQCRIYNGVMMGDTDDVSLPFTDLKTDTII